MKFVKRKW